MYNKWEKCSFKRKKRTRSPSWSGNHFTDRHTFIVLVSPQSSTWKQSIPINDVRKWIYYRHFARRLCKLGKRILGIGIQIDKSFRICKFLWRKPFLFIVIIYFQSQFATVFRSHLHLLVICFISITGVKKNWKRKTSVFGILYWSSTRTFIANSEHWRFKRFSYTM